MKSKALQTAYATYVNDTSWAETAEDERLAYGRLLAKVHAIAKRRHLSPAILWDELENETAPTGR